MKKIFYTLLSGIILVSCSSGGSGQAEIRKGIDLVKKEKAINGSFLQSARSNIKGALVSGLSDSSKIYLIDYQQNSPQLYSRIDSAIVKDGQFYFPNQTDSSLTEPLVRLVELIDDSTSTRGLIFDEGNNTEVIISPEGIFAVNTELNEKNFKIVKFLKRNWKKMRSLSKLRNSTSDKSIQHEMNRQIEKLSKENTDKVFRFISENIDNPLGMIYFEDWVGQLSPRQLEEILSIIPQKTIEQDETFRRWEEILKYMKKRAVGQSYTDISGQNINNNEISLSDYVGKNKLVLVDFWNSGCGGCIATMQPLKEIYEKYHDKGLEIVGVALDWEKEHWLQTINENELPWPQMFDTDPFSDKASDKYGIVRTPFFVLINQKGVIIDTSSDLQNIKRLIAKRLNKFSAN